MQGFIRICAALALCALFSAPAAAAERARPADEEATRIYGAWADAVYQVQVIDVVSGKKNSIGSGFQFAAGGLLATNYHVVSDAIMDPEGSRIEYMRAGGERGVLTLLAADVVHDLAILKMDRPGRLAARLGSSRLPKGSKVYALGNPHDIGFTIIEGTYNGLAQESFVDKIHFSGALNTGMSGGPALDRAGDVLGINVSTAGNEISFLVPVERLRTLAASAGAEEGGFLDGADAHIEAQLLDSQKHNMDVLLGKTWESVPFGPFLLPGRVHPALKCWGKTMHDDKDPYRHYSSICETQDDIFIADDFSAGAVATRYDYLAAKEELNAVRFTSFYEKLYSMPAGGGEGLETDVTRYACHTGFVRAAERPWKASFCVRRYRRYPRLYDMQLDMALVGSGGEGMVLSADLTGVSRESALAFSRRFMQEIRVKEEGRAHEARP